MSLHKFWRNYTLSNPWQTPDPIWKILTNTSPYPSDIFPTIELIMVRVGLWAMMKFLGLGAKDSVHARSCWKFSKQTAAAELMSLPLPQFRLGRRMSGLQYLQPRSTICWWCGKHVRCAWLPMLHQAHSYLQCLTWVLEKECAYGIPSSR